MAYIIEEQLDAGEMSRVGEPLEGLLVAKAVAARHANRSGRLTVVKDASRGDELARYGSAVLSDSVRRMRVCNDRLRDRIGGKVAKKA